MWKQQRLHDYILSTGLVTADSLSVYNDNGLIDWEFSPDVQSFGLKYRTNMLFREYAGVPHLLFLAVVSGLAMIDPNPDGDAPHDLGWQTSTLDRTTVDLEITVNFSEWYCYREPEGSEKVQGFVDGKPVIFVPPEISPLGYFQRFALKMDDEHHL